ncbi:MAG: ABC transporter ATP-binding protein [bacterium]|nr:ABC transporter ATP-binding protein [bacterium]
MQQSSKKMASARSVFRVYWSHSKKYRAFIAAIFLSGVIMQAANLTAPLYLRQLFNVLATHTRDAATAQVLIGILAIVALAWLTDRLFRRVQDIFNVTMQSRVMAGLFDDAFSYLMGHSYGFFISNFAGSLTHRVTKFARAYETLFDTVMITFIPTLVFVLGAVGVLFSRNHILGLSLGLWCIAFVWFQIFVARVRQPARNARSEADTRITAALSDSIGNQSAVTLFSGVHYEWQRFHSVVEVWRAATLRNWLIDGWFWGGISLFIVGIQVGLFWGAILLWQQNLLTIGDFVLIQAYLMTVFDQLVGINRDMRRFFDALADASEMVYILEQPHDVRDAPSAVPLKVQNGEIVFNQTKFFFKDAKVPILSDFDLRIKGGEKVALVGPSGAGKSTVTRLLLRLFDVTGGSIEIDGQNISHVIQESLRDAIAYVPQEPVLFHRSLMENIRYGRREASDAEVIEVARKAHCHEFISGLPAAYETFVGERGVRLSGGERQRVAIARAILKNAPILILDEATSSLDSESEALIQSALEILMQGKTVVVIAHRLSTIMKMDRIIVLEGGTIKAEGTHQKLLASGGLYQKLWSIQAGGFLDEPSGEESGLEVLMDEEEDDAKEPKGTVLK